MHSESRDRPIRLIIRGPGTKHTIILYWAKRVQMKTVHHRPLKESIKCIGSRTSILFRQRLPQNTTLEAMYQLQAPRTADTHRQKAAGHKLQHVHRKSLGD